MRQHRVLALACAAAGALAAQPSIAGADAPRRIGIVVTLEVNTEPGEADALATELGDVLVQERPVDVISGTETTRRLPTEGLPEECVADAECRNDLGRRLDADELLMLVIVKLGDQIQIDATWANVASGAVTSRPQIVIDAGADRRAVFVAAAPKLLPHITKDTDKGPNIVIVPGQQVVTDGRHFTTGTWIATGVAAVALIGGGVFALSAQNKFSTLEDDGCREMPCDAGEIDSLRTSALAADILFGVAAASAVTAVVLYMRSGGAERVVTDTATPEVEVTLVPGGIGLSYGGSF